MKVPLPLIKSHQPQQVLVGLFLVESFVAVPSALALPMGYSGSTTVMLDVDPHWSTLSITKAIDRQNGIGISLNYLPINTAHDGHQGSSVSDSNHTEQGNEVFTLVDATRLIHRWNLPSAQANLWLFAGLGTYNASGTRNLVIRQQVVTVTNTGETRVSSQSLPASSCGHPGHSCPPLPTPPLPVPGSSTSIVETSQIETTPPSLRLAVRPGLQFDAETSRLRLESRAMIFMAQGIQRPLLTATAGAALTPASYENIQPWIELQIRAMPGVVDKLELVPKLRLLHHRIVLDIGYSNLGTIVGGMTYTF